MIDHFLARFPALLLTLVVGLVGSSSAFGSVTISIQNGDAPLFGFNDPTPVAQVGGNNGTTLGQQRLNAFQFAANVWGATLSSGPPITVQASWSSSMPCTPDAGTLGSAGAVNIRKDFANAQFAGTWYSVALANNLSGSDLNGTAAEINAQFNVRVGTAGCLQASPWYLGLDGNHGAGVDLVTVLLHEFAHGLGFQTFTSSTTGAQASGFPSVYDRFLFDDTTGKSWVDMTNVERVASAINTGNLVWIGPRVTSDAGRVLGTPRLRVNSPGGIAGNYQVGTAVFGPRLFSPGIAGNLVQSLPNDACSAISNPGAVSGKIAVVDRGTCNFTVKVRNAQDAGAIGVIVVNNVAGPPPGMAGSDATITIPSVSIAQTDGAAIKGQLGSGVNASILLDTSVTAGTDPSGRPLLFAPNPVQGGSSVSHWDTTAFPNQLMEPNISDDLTHSVMPPEDLTFSLLRDIGWSGGTGNPIDGAGFFVRQHYVDFLNREPDTSGLNFWTGEITQCGTDAACTDLKRINVSAAFFLSIEFQETGYLVYRVYKSGFGNLSASVPVPVRFNEFLRDTQQIGQGVQVGVGNWQAQLEANKQAYALAFVQRPEFLVAFPGSLTADQFVTQLDSNAGGVLSAGEKANLVAVLGGTPADVTKRASVLRSVAEDTDLKNAEFNKAFVLMQYFGYLRRNPNDAPDSDFSGYNFWLGKLNQFNGNFVNAEMVKAFITSIEYRRRFAP